VTADVKSLYPSIPIDESIDLILTELQSHQNPTHPPIFIILRQILNFILHNNCFNYADLIFLQVRGIAMGTPMAPDFANLLMSCFEDKFVFNLGTKPAYYRRYIDDLLFTWDDTHDELIKFMDYLNNCHPTIKFTSESSPTEVTYLDLKLVKEDTSIYVKPHLKKPTPSPMYMLRLITIKPYLKLSTKVKTYVFFETALNKLTMNPPWSLFVRNSLRDAMEK